MGFQEEYEALQGGKGISDFSHWGKLVFSGPERKKFLHGLLSNDILALTPGNSCSACLLTPKGMLLADMDLFDRREDILAVMQLKALPNALAALSKRIVLSDAKMEDVSAQALFHVPAKTARALPYDKIVPGGGLLLCPKTQAAPLWDSLVAGGLTSVGPAALDAARIERGVPWFGVDMGTDTIPLEARLLDSISFAKGCYMGQETITRIKDRGHVNKTLVTLRVEGSETLSVPAAVLKDGARVGAATSSAWSPKHKAALALATIAAASAAPGAKLEAAGRSAEVLG